MRFWRRTTRAAAEKEFEDNQRIENGEAVEGESKRAGGEKRDAQQPGKPELAGEATKEEEDDAECRDGIATLSARAAMKLTPVKRKRSEIRNGQTEERPQGCSRRGRTNVRKGCATAALLHQPSSVNFACR